jgi:hypothetical protein
MHSGPDSPLWSSSVDTVSTAKPETVGLGSALAANMAEVRSRFDGVEWSAREHYKIRRSEPVAVEEENRFLRAFREKLASEEGMSDKSRRVSQQVGPSVRSAFG